MILRPPISTLFPYTTLSDLSCSIWAAMTQSFWSSGLLRGRCNRRLARDPRAGFRRSEEHTSELQSLRHLVCRLLLEKKKQEELDNDEYTERPTHTRTRL